MTAKATTAPPLAALTVRDAMRPGVVTCLREDGLATIAAIMVTHGIHAVVLPAAGAGAARIVTDIDLVRAALERPEAHATEIAHEPAVTLTADSKLDAAVATMAEHYVRHLLITEPESGGSAGVLSSLDVAAVVGGHEPRLVRMLRPAPARPMPSARPLGATTVADVMHPGVATCKPDARLATVARMMAQQRVHCVAVAGIEQPGRHLTWGMIEDMALVLALHAGGAGDPASEIALTAPLAVEETESLSRTAELMVEHATGHVVVVGSSGLPAGVVSTLDVAGVLAAAA
jgi:CBS domain-containing protein